MIYTHIYTEIFVKNNSTNEDPAYFPMLRTLGDSIPVEQLNIRDVRVSEAENRT